MRPSQREAWSRDLLESDRRYFEAGAERIGVAGATIACLRGAESLAAGCVVQRIEAAKNPEERAAAWLAEIESQLRSLGCPLARIYLDQPLPGLEAALAQRGYRSRVELGFARAASAVLPRPNVELVLADDDYSWSARRKILERCRLGPDGHRVDPDLWIEMERRKYRAGHLRPYLISAGGDIAGATCLATCGSLLRLKNLFVDPDSRRCGVATATAICAVRLAGQEGLAAAGCFAVAGEPGVTLYSLAGYRVTTRQTEWVRDLAGAAEA